MKADIVLDAHQSLTDGAMGNHRMLMMAAAIVGLLLFLAVVRLVRLQYLHLGRLP